MLELIHLDEALVAIAKPSGLVVHRSERAGDSRNCMSLLRDQLRRRVHPVHRLDRGASGVLLFALDPVTVRDLARAFARRQVVKSYLAVVRGWTPDSGRVERPLAREDGRMLEASTAYRRLARAELPCAVGRYATARYSLVEAEPLTGRTHQLRRHLAGISHPIVGDVTHGDGRHNRFFRERFASSRLLLHCRALKLRHPASGAPLELQAPPPRELQELLAALGWSGACDAGAAPARPALALEGGGA